MSERKSTLLILSQAPNFTLTQTKLAQELIARKQLSFGVKVEDLIREMERRGEIRYNSETEEVTLNVANTIRLLIESNDRLMTDRIQSALAKSA